MHGQHAEDAFNAARAAQQMAGHGFGGIDHCFLRMIPKSHLDGVGLIQVAQRRGCAVRVDIADLVGIDTRVLERHLHRAPRPVYIGRSHMVGIAAHAKTSHFSINFGTACFGVFVFFQHQNTGAFAQNKTFTVFVPRTRSRLRVVITGAERSGGGKTTQTKRRNSAFRTTGNHDIAIAVFNHACRQTNGVQPCGAGRDDGNIGAFEAKFDRYMTRDHVDDGGGNEKWGDTTRPPVDILHMGLLNGGQAPNARTDVATNATRLFQAQRIAGRQP